MRILQLTKHYPPYFGGIETVVFDITEGMNQLGFQCDVLCVNDRFKSVRDTDKPYRVFRVALLTKLFSTSLAPGLLWKLKRIVGKYDVLQVHFPDPMSALAIFFARPKRRIVVHWHSDIVKQKTLLKYYKPLQDWILKRADVIIGTSPDYIASSSSLTAFREKTVCIPIGINPQSMPADEARVADIRARYPGKKIVFSLGRQVYYKGFEYLVEAARHTDDNTVILIGGTGELHETLKTQIAEAGLQHKVVLLGRVSSGEIGSYFKACDIFCLPSIERSEAFGVVLLEAMMFGKPIVATAIPGSGVGWVNQHGITGVNVPVKDAKALGEAISGILKDENLYRTLSANALQRFAEHFTNTEMIRKFMDLYSRLQ